MAKVTVRLLRPDSSGHMLRLFDAYARPEEHGGDNYKLLRTGDFTALLTDLAGSAATTMNTQPLFEQYARVERSLQTEGEAVIARALNEPCIGFRVFPALLADLAGQLYAASEAPAARQLFMKNHVIPLSEAIAAGKAQSDRQVSGAGSAMLASGDNERLERARSSSPKKDRFEHVSPRYLEPKKAVQQEEDVDASAGSASLTPAQLQQFLARQEKAAEVSKARKDAIYERVREEEEGRQAVMSHHVPQLSRGTEKILKKLEEQGSSESIPRHVPDSLSGGSTPGRALYANAMRKLERQEAARQEQEAQEHEQRNAKRASDKSEAMVRRRLARELAAACVYIAAQRANIATSAAMGATADGSLPSPSGPAPAAAYYSPDSGTMSGKPELIPWWLLCLTPGETATVLHHTGFLLGAVLEPAKAALVLTHADAFARFSTAVHQGSSAEARGSRGLASPLSVTSTFFAQAVAKHLPPGVSVSEAEQARQLSLVWRAAAAGSSPLPNTIPSVRLLALVQSLVTGAYDVRPAVLSVAAKDIGMARPFVLAMPLPTAPPRPASPTRRPKSPGSPRSMAMSHVSGGGKSSMGLTAGGSSMSGGMSFSPSAAGGGNVLMRTYSTSETHADNLSSRPNRREATHAAAGFGLDLGIIRSPSKSGGGLVSTLHPDVPSIFHAALTEHLSRLRALGQANGAEASGDALPDPPVDSFVAPPLAEDVLAAHVVFSAASLLALKPLYSNRLAFLSTLSRKDGRRAVAAAASRDVIEQDYKPRPPGVREELGDGFVRALHGNDPDAPDLTDDGIGLGRQASKPSVGPSKGGPKRVLTSVDECTFAPALCKKSMEIAERQSAALAGGSPTREEDEDDGADSIDPRPGLDTGKIAPATTTGPILRREVLMMRYKANVEARNAELRRAKDDAEMAGCPFKPDTSATAAYRAAQQADHGMAAGRIYVPNYTSLVQTAVYSVPGAADDPTVLDKASETPWVTRAAPLDALATTTGGAGSRAEWLYHLAGIRKAALEHASEVHHKALEAVELKGCTFKPQTNWGRTRALAASRRDAGAIVDRDEESPFDDGTGSFPSEEDEVVQVEIPLGVGTDAALVLAQPDGPAIQPHLQATGQMSGLAVDPANGKATISVSRRLAGAKGLDTHLARVLRGRAEKEEKKRLDAALSAGVLHKKAVVRDSQGRTIVKPFAFVASFKRMAHQGFIADEDDTAIPGSHRRGSSVSHSRPGSAAPQGRLDLDSQSQTQQWVRQPDGRGMAGLASPGLMHPSEVASPEPVQQTTGYDRHEVPAVQEESQANNEPPLMFVDVTVAAGQIERLPVWRETDLSSLASDFAEKHGLAKRTARRLEKMMKAQRDAVLHGGTTAGAGDE